MRLRALPLLTVLLAPLALGQDPPTTPATPTPTETPAGQPQTPPGGVQSPDAAAQDPKDPANPGGMEAALAAFKPRKGTVEIGDQAKVALADGWLWLADRHARRFLMQLGNPEDPSVLGVAIAADFEESNVFAVYSYADDGHVDDSEEPDFDQLLKDMKENSVEESKHRREAGLPTFQFLGWAEPPHYDKATRKMYWAERLKFSGEESDTLNYNVRVLGRTGHLVVRGVGGIEQLPLVATHCKSLLQATEFVEGQRYENFDPAYDKVAAYGIGGLVAGKLALKAGLFAKLLLMLKAFIKPILIGLVAIGAIVVKALGGRRAAAAAEARAGRRSQRNDAN